MNTDVKTAKWKYLRETDKKYFDCHRNTPLNEYIEHIFPNVVWVYDAAMKMDIIKSRAAGRDVPYRRYRPDARCEELNLIVEFDGVAHYQDQKVVLQDIERDKWFNDLGYKVVRIPYWIQLSKQVIKELFGVNIDEPMCELPYSFYDPDSNDPGLSISVGSMAEAGRDRFIAQYNKFSKDIQCQIRQDIRMCMRSLPEELPYTYILPEAVAKQIWDEN